MGFGKSDVYAVRANTRLHYEMIVRLIDIKVLSISLFLPLSLDLGAPSNAQLNVWL